jgi:DNA-binding HxlR family transcriptional regulator
MRSDGFRYSPENCSIAATLQIVGEKWTLLVLREAFFGVTRFAEFHRALGCARNVLSARLKTLVEEGLLFQRPYREPGSRIRHEYHLTEKGLDLFPVLVALMQWGDRWSADAAGPQVALSHRDCGQPACVELRCAAGHGPLSAHDVKARPGGSARVAA